MTVRHIISPIDFVAQGEGLAARYSCPGTPVTVWTIHVPGAPVRVELECGDEAVSRLRVTDLSTIAAAWGILPGPLWLPNAAAWLRTLTDQLTPEPETP